MLVKLQVPFERKTNLNSVFVISSFNNFNGFTIVTCGQKWDDEVWKIL